MQRTIPRLQLAHFGSSLLQSAHTPFPSSRSSAISTILSAFLYLLSLGLGDFVSPPDAQRFTAFEMAKSCSETTDTVSSRSPSSPVEKPSDGDVPVRDRGTRRFGEEREAGWCEERALRTGPLKGIPRPSSIGRLGEERRSDPSERAKTPRRELGSK